MKNKNQSGPNKHQRLWVSLTLLATGGISWLFYLLGHPPKLVGEKKLSPPTPLSTTFPLPITNRWWEILDSKIEPLLATVGGEWGFWVWDEASDKIWQKNGQKKFTAASLIKLPVVLAFWQEVEAGRLNPQTPWRLHQDDVRPGAGILQTKPPGYTTTLGNLAHLALNQSDNTAFVALVKIVGQKAIRHALQTSGMYQTSLEENTTTPADIGRFFRRLLTGELLNSSHRQQFFTSLTNTAFENRLPAGLPEGIKVAHKVGTEVGVVADAGVVFAPDRHLILVILSQKVNPAKAEALFPKLTETIYWTIMAESE